MMIREMIAELNITGGFVTIKADGQVVSSVALETATLETIRSRVTGKEPLATIIADLLNQGASRQSRLTGTIPVDIADDHLIAQSQQTLAAAS